MIIDIVLVILLLVSIAVGYHHGFIWQVLKLVQTVFLIVILFLFGNQIIGYFVPMFSPWVSQQFLQSVPEIARPQMSELIIRIVLSMGLFSVSNFFLNKVIRIFHGKIIKKIPVVGITNALLGSIFSVFEYLIVVCLVIAALPVIGTELSMYVHDQSHVVKVIESIFPVIVEFFQANWH